jgi:hypothetical protein
MFTPERIALIVTSVLAAVGLVSFAVRKRDKLTDLKRDFLALQTLLNEHGMKHFAKILECLAVEDLPGAVGEAKFLVRQLHDPKLAAALLEGVFTQNLDSQLASVGGRVSVLKRIADWAVANPEAVKAAGLVIALLPK